MARHARIILMATACGLSMAAPCAHAQQASYNFTTYNISPTAISWITCGSTPQSSGCFGSGQFGPFGRVCAVLEGRLETHGQTAKQPVYVMDSNVGNAGKVALDVYRKTVVSTQSTITTTFTLTDSLSLPLTGGAAVTCQAAANKAVIAAGTGASTVAALINKKSLAVSSYGGFSPPEDVSSIVVDAQGYLSINFTGGFYLLDPAGQSIEDGGGNAIVIPGDNAYLP